MAEVIERNGGNPTDSVLLVTSELVTNAVRYGAGDVELRVDVNDGCVRLEVLDQGHVELHAPSHAPTAAAPGGRGLHLVGQVADNWGAGFDPSGRTLVWAEVSVS